ncbi:uncharacterized protein LOC110722624 [Chenopodium quinoa]|uniref:uncharacterized protein LOC110722624 n=1 Tax=Chenopodium quinoa TaxID=63459 RepID=UPI000B784075|nr:uncharacterized protein LOC110722624 [Chenopodium quinoa]
MKPGATALELWTRLEEIFHDNKHTRAVYLEEQFAKTKLENFANMSDYCKQLKLLADQLANVDCPVSDRKMVMQLIAGLTMGEYDTVAAIVSQSDPTPSFNKARSMFLLEETRQNKQSESGQHALVAQHSQSPTSGNTPTSQSPVSDHQQTGGGGGRGKGKGRGSSNGKGKGRGKNRNNNNTQQQQATGPNANQAQQQQQSPQWGRSYGWAPRQQGQWASPPCPFPTGLVGAFSYRGQQQGSILGPRPQQNQAYYVGSQHGYGPPITDGTWTRGPLLI